MPDEEKAVAVAKAWAVVDDIENEVGPCVERLDVEKLLQAAQFVPHEHPWGWLWRNDKHGVLYPTYREMDVSPATDAKWLVGMIKTLKLLPDRT